MAAGGRRRAALAGGVAADPRAHFWGHPAPANAVAQRGGPCWCWRADALAPRTCREAGVVGVGTAAVSLQGPSRGPSNATRWQRRQSRWRVGPQWPSARRAVCAQPEDLGCRRLRHPLRLDPERGGRGGGSRQLQRSGPVLRRGRCRVAAAGRWRAARQGGVAMRLRAHGRGSSATAFAEAPRRWPWRCWRADAPRPRARRQAGVVDVGTAAMSPQGRRLGTLYLACGQRLLRRLVRGGGSKRRSPSQARRPRPECFPYHPPAQRSRATRRRPEC